MKDVVRLSWVGNEIDDKKASEAIDAPQYKTKKYKQVKPPDYIDRILSATSGTDYDGDNALANSESKNGGDNEVHERTCGEANREYEEDHGKTDEEREVQSLVNAMKESIDLKKFTWTTERDYGHFELVHYDEPTPPDRIAAILESIMEENRLEKEFLHITNNITSSSSTATPRLQTPSQRCKSKKSKENSTVVTLKVPIKLSQEEHIHSPVLDGNWVPPMESELQPTPLSSRPPSSLTKQKKVKKKKKKSRVLQCSSTEYDCVAIKRTVESTIMEYFTGKSYDADESKHMGGLIADLIKTKVKHLYPPRYRLICIVSIVETKQQSIRIASRGLWDTSRDKVIEYCYSNGEMDVLCMVYAIYKE